MKEEHEEPLLEDDVEDEVVEIDDLLDEDTSLSDYDDKDEIDNITYSLKIDNDSTDGEPDD
jgi:hypothetical protein